MYKKNVVNEFKFLLSDSCQTTRNFKRLKLNINSFRTIDIIGCDLYENPDKSSGSQKYKYH